MIADIHEIDLTVRHKCDDSRGNSLGKAFAQVGSERVINVGLKWPGKFCRQCGCEYPVAATLAVGDP